MMETPTVSFVVPCYRLGRFLAECVDSILSQSYNNIEIVILDDQSPDNAAEVSRGIVSAHPHRKISYIVNSENLGNIRNYNKGIRIAVGEYVWILSPDDRLRSQYIVEKYVRLMESRQDVGYTFCPGHRVENNQDMGVHKSSLYRAEDQILDGLQLVRDIVDNNFELLSPSVMIRKTCYEEVALFPEDMPHRGDSYVWALIAMQYKVGYLAEAMVDYRIHHDSMMSTLARESFARIVEDDIMVLWRIKAEAEKRKHAHIVHQCWSAIIRIYARALSGIGCRGHSYRLPLWEFETSLSNFESDRSARSRIRYRVLDAFGDRLYWHKRFSEAADIYEKANAACGKEITWTKLNVLTKLVLLRSGKVGVILRYSLGKVHQLSRNVEENVGCLQSQIRRVGYHLVSR